MVGSFGRRTCPALKREEQPSWGLATTTGIVSHPPGFAPKVEAVTFTVSSETRPLEKVRCQTERSWRQRTEEKLGRKSLQRRFGAKETCSHGGTQRASNLSPFLMDMESRADAIFNNALTKACSTIYPRSWRNTINLQWTSAVSPRGSTCRAATVYRYQEAHFHSGTNLFRFFL